MSKQTFLVEVTTKLETPFLSAYIFEAITEWGADDHPEKEYRSENIKTVLVRKVLEDNSQ